MPAGSGDTLFAAAPPVFVTVIWSVMVWPVARLDGKAASDAESADACCIFTFEVAE